MRALGQNPTEEELKEMNDRRGRCRRKRINRYPRILSLMARKMKESDT